MIKFRSAPKSGLSFLLLKKILHEGRYIKIKLQETLKICKREYQQILIYWNRQKPKKVNEEIDE